MAFKADITTSGIRCRTKLGKEDLTVNGADVYYSDEFAGTRTRSCRRNDDRGGRGRQRGSAARHPPSGTLAIPQDSRVVYLWSVRRSEGMTRAVAEAPGEGQ